MQYRSAHSAKRELAHVIDDWERNADLRMELCHFGKLCRLSVFDLDGALERLTGSNAIKLEFSIDILLLGFDISGSVDTCGRHGC